MCSFVCVVKIMQKLTKVKFILNFKIGVFYWTAVQTLNYTFIPERNRVPMVSLFGLLWTTFLAYMKQKPTANTSNIQFVDNNTNTGHSAVLK